MHTKATSMFFRERISGMPEVSPDTYTRLLPNVSTYPLPRPLVWRESGDSGRLYMGTAVIDTSDTDFVWPLFNTTALDFKSSGSLSATACGTTNVAFDKSI